MQVYQRLIALFMIFQLTGCNGYNFSRQIIQQGNLLTPAVVNRLKIGMPKEEVAILMGTSLISPLFNNNRWDYAYTKYKGNRFTAMHHLVLTFKHDTLIKIENIS